MNFTWRPVQYVLMARTWLDDTCLIWNWRKHAGSMARLVAPRVAPRRAGGARDAEHSDTSPPERSPSNALIDSK